MTLTSGMCWRFAKTLVVVAAAVVLRKAIEGRTGAPLPMFITFYPVVMFTALSMGLGAGLLATGASMLMVDYFVVSPGQLGNWSLGEAVGQGLFTCLGVAMSLFAHHYRQMQQRLEILVAERTSELEQGKAELKESQKQEARERSLMGAVMEALPTGVAVTDASGGTIRFNTTYNTIWGEQRPETASVEEYADYTAWWDDTDRPVLPEEWASARAIRGETVLGQVLRIRRFDGSEAFVINSASPVYDADGVIAGSVVAIQDITALKKVEAELRNSEQKMKALINTANESIWQFGLDGEIISANVTATRRIGLSVEELVGKKWQDIVPPALVDSRTRKIEEVVRTRAPVTFEDERAGMFFEHCAYPVCDEQGTVTSVAIFSRDITVRRQAEEKQRSNEERLRLAFQAANAGAWEWNLETNENIWSDELWELYGIEPHSCEPSYETWLKTIHPDDRVRVGQAVRDAARYEREVAVEWRVCGDDGAGERWLMSRGQPQRCADGCMNRYIGIVLDITASKKAEKELYDKDTRLQGAYHELQVAFVEIKTQEEELQERHHELGLLWEQAQRSERSLRESEKRFHDIVDITADWIWEIDLNGSYTFTSGRVKELLGYEPEELLGRTPFDLMPPDEAKRVFAEFKTVLSRRNMVLDYLNINIHKNGELRFIQTSGVPIYDSEGELCGYRGVDKDVTARVRAQERLDILAETASLLLLSDSPQEVVESLCLKVMAALDCQLFFNFLVDDEQNRLYLNACSGIPEQDRLKIEWLDFGVAVCGCAARDCCRIVAEDIANTPDPRTELVKSYGVTAYACHPLMAQDRVLGTLSFGSRTRTAFTDEDLSLMKVVADHAAIAIERMRTTYALYKSHDELEQRVVERTHELASSINQLKDEISERVRTEQRRLEAEQTLREETLQRLQAVEALRRQEHLMIQQNRQAAMGEMISNIAHQWRQPLNTLGLLTQRVGYFYGSPQFNQEFVDTSVAKAMEIINYMSCTIDDFRTFFAVDREKSDFRADETVTKVLSLIEASFKDKRISLERDEEEDVVINGYPNEYAQVLLNILINAKDAMNERNIESPWLKITVKSRNGASYVTIADNAGGIPHDIINKVFDPYFTTKGPQQGTGIGLFMAKSIIETNMGGRISVHNTGSGAEFVIEV